MSFVVTGNAVEALVDAMKTRLTGDATLGGMVTGVYGYVPEAQRTAYPYLKIGDQALDDTFPVMGKFSGQARVPIDSWSNDRGPHVMRTILARVLVLLEREVLSLGPSYLMVAGSLHCVTSVVFEEPDPNMPDKRLYHGHQEWEADLEEV